MLELRPCCEHCAKDLPPASSEAMICTFECTYCENCVHTLFENVCPNCGGGFVSRPIRPAKAHKAPWYLGEHPAQTQRRHKPKNIEEFKKFSADLKKIDPKYR